MQALSIADQPAKVPSAVKKARSTTAFTTRKSLFKIKQEKTRMTRFSRKRRLKEKKDKLF